VTLPGAAPVPALAPVIRFPRPGCRRSPTVAIFDSTVLEMATAARAGVDVQRVEVVLDGVDVVDVEGEVARVGDRERFLARGEVLIADRRRCSWCTCSS
jgi:hypothetical protein